MQEMKILLFGGTTEGRMFASWLCNRQIAATICVATEYGESLLPAGLDVRVGRLDLDGMLDLMGDGYTHVVDATHPYAQIVTENIKTAARNLEIPYLRLLRDGEVDGDWLHAEDIPQAAEICENLEGNILLTTGSKELAPFAADQLRNRTYPRVLPTLDSLQRCLEFGFPVGQILCMQGPFSQKLNEGLLEQFDIKILVTKASGGAGGFWEKVNAAQTCGVKLIVIDRPNIETGYSLEQMKKLEIFNR